MRTLASEFGEMLPKTGVYSLPDFKILAFLKILADYSKRLASEGNYKQAAGVDMKFKQISKIEFNRQIRKMENRQNTELLRIEEI